MIVQKGNYKTRCGFDAVVGRIKTINKVFVAQGVIKEPFSEVMALHQWMINGDSLSNQACKNQFDLVAEAT